MTQALAAPKAHFLLGHLPELSRDHLGFVLDTARRYGDFVPLKFGRRTTVLLSNPRDVEDVLVTRQRNFTKGYFYRILGPLLGNGLLTSEGDFWLRQRRLAQPAFHRERINSYAEAMVRFTQQLLTSWRAGEVRDVHDDMMRLTLRIAMLEAMLLMTTIAQTWHLTLQPGHPIELHPALTLRPKHGLRMSLAAV